MAKIVVIGAGTWGVAIANLLANNGNEVVVWARNIESVNELNKTHIHKNLKDVHLNEKILFSNNYQQSISNKNVVVMAIPSNAFRDVAKEVVKYVNDENYIVSLTKGMEDKTLFTMSEIFCDELQKANIINDKIVVLSGPTHAEEVGKNFPSTIVSASKNEDAAKYVQDLFMNENFRVYTNSDIKGVEICAAFKNIIALASGILVGLGYGDNIKAALLTRGLTEMTRICERIGCEKTTFYGLAGIGDMIVTACSEHSRNYRCGKYIGEGFNVNEAVKKVGMVVESINFVPKALTIRDKYNVDLPITSGIGKIVLENANPKDILTLLMTRKKKSE